MATQEEHQKAEKQFTEFWKPVETLFRSAKTRNEVQEACTKAEQKTGMTYGYGIGYYDEPMKEGSETIDFHGWMFDEEKTMISVWYTHGYDKK